MREPIQLRRYLVPFSSHKLPQVFTDILVIGSGIAGLRAALDASEGASVLLATKGAIQDGSTNDAQGGVAAALASEDSPRMHFEDTLAVGCGLCNEDAVRLLTSEGPERIEELIQMGVPFDRAGEELSRAREGGHRRARIVHARGDATGAAIEHVMAQQARGRGSVQVYENTFTIDLLAVNNACHGALLWNEVHGLLMARAKQTILATGGCGRIYRETTNPPVVTGDGLAMAFRARAELQDLEFVQFHPTTLYVAGASRALISEALRGEGGVLRNRHGDRFMSRCHPEAELAPRDVVSRSIIQEMKQTGHTNVYLDVTGLSSAHLQERFPTITELCARFDLDISRDYIPVRPAAHYMIGGVRTDTDGQTSIANLLACGEVACTGVHGANRLGSNSLLEGLVFGRRAALRAVENIKKMTEPLPLHAIQGLPREPSYGSLNLTDVENSLKSLMWRSVGVNRNQTELDEAVEMITFWCRYVMDREFEDPSGWQLQNMLTVARLIAMSARQREESRGVHYRTDYPQTSEHWRRHIVISNYADQWL